MQNRKEDPVATPKLQALQGEDSSSASSAPPPNKQQERFVEEDKDPRAVAVYVVAIFIAYAMLIVAIIVRSFG